LHRAGLAEPACLQDRWWALTPPFHPCPHRDDVAAAGGLLSVALSLGFPRLDAVQRPALRCPDFPRRRRRRSSREDRTLTTPRPPGLPSQCTTL